MTIKQPKLSLTPELASALGGRHLTQEQVERLKSEPHSFLAEVDIAIEENTSIHAVENSASEVHLALPFYSSLEEARAIAISDSSIEDVSGGEIFFLVAALCVGALAGGAYYVADKAKKAGRDATYKVLTGEGDPQQQEGGK